MRRMARLAVMACFWSALAGCSALPAPKGGAVPAACDGGNENAWACQIQRYHDVAAD
jgi:hypothetical protein